MSGPDFDDFLASTAERVQFVKEFLAEARKFGLAPDPERSPGAETMRRMGDIAKIKKLPCTITPADLHAHQRCFKFEIGHGKPGPTKTEIHARRKSA